MENHFKENKKLKEAPASPDPKSSKYINKSNFQFDVFPEDKLQEKVDYYITPYNNIIALNKYMDFGDELNLNMVKNPNDLNAAKDDK